MRGKALFDLLASHHDVAAGSVRATRVVDTRHVTLLGAEERVTVEVHIVPWASLRVGAGALRDLVEQLSPELDQERFIEVLRAPPAVAKDLAYRGPAGTLAAELARLLACPLVRDALTVTLVPFSICGFDDPHEAFEVDFYASATGQIHRHVDGIDPHLFVDCHLVQERWAELQEDVNFGLRLDEARSDAEGTDERRGLALLHDLVERLVPAARRLGLPVVIEFLGRKRLEDAPAGSPFERQLDALFGGDGSEDEAPAEMEDPEPAPDLGVVVLHPFGRPYVDVLESALKATAHDYELDPSTLRVAFTAFRAVLVVHLRAPGFRDAYDLHAKLDMRHEPALGGSFGASLSGHLIDALEEDGGPAPGAWTVMLEQGEPGAVAVHEGFMYTHEGTDHGSGRGPLARLANRLALPASVLEDALTTPGTPYVPVADGLDAHVLRQLRSRL